VLLKGGPSESGVQQHLLLLWRLLLLLLLLPLQELLLRRRRHLRGRLLQGYRQLDCCTCCC